MPDAPVYWCPWTLEKLGVSWACRAARLSTMKSEFLTTSRARPSRDSPPWDSSSVMVGEAETVQLLWRQDRSPPASRSFS